MNTSYYVHYTVQYSFFPRLHLKELGFTIVNDDLYTSDSAADCQEKGEEEFPCPSSEYNVTRMARIAARLKEFTETGSLSASKLPISSWLKPSASSERPMPRFEFCANCLDGGAISPEVSRPSFIGLHSYRYRLGERDLRSEMPAWATRPEMLINRTSAHPTSTWQAET